MRTSRRELLTLIGTGAASVALGAKAADAAPKPAPKGAKAKRGTIIGPGFYIDDASGQKSFVVAMVDLDAEKRERKEISIDFFGHGVSPNPIRPHEACVFEKKGPGACVVDLVERKMLQKITTSPGHRFYGHGAWLADGSRVLVVESAIDKGFEGLISIRDGKTFEPVGEFPTYGLAPHDCLLLDGGKVLAITNGGGDVKGAAPSVTWVDTKTHKLLEKVEFSTPRINAGHLALTKKKELAVVSAPRDGLGPDLNKERGGISLRTKSGKVETMEEPADVTRRMIGETLSVCIHEPTSIVAATNPEGNLVTFWDLKTAKLVKHLELEKPRGVTLTLDGQHFVVSYSKASALVLVDPKTLEPVKDTAFEPTYMTGSHVIAYAI